MPKATRKPDAGPVVWYDDEFGVYSWDPEAEDRLRDAADELLEYNDVRLLIKILLDLNLLPGSVDRSLHQWLLIALRPNLSPKDRAAWDAAREYGRTPFKRTADKPAESANAKAKRVLDTQPPEEPGRWRKYGVTEKAVLRIANTSGSQYLRIRSYSDAVSKHLGKSVPEGRAPGRPRKQYRF